MSSVNRLLEIAYNELGWHEGPKGGTKYATWFGLPRQDWCAMFVCWCFCQTFGEDNWTKYIERTALASLPILSVESLKADYVKKPGAKSTIKAVSPGDIFCEGTAKNQVRHTGLVYEVNRSERKIVTIEGNYGDKVSSRKLSISDCYCIVRPHYEDSSLDLSKGIEKLYSSQNFQRIEEDEEESVFTKSSNYIMNSLKGLSSYNNQTVPSEAVAHILEHKIKKEERKTKTTVKAELASFPTLVEAPVVNVYFNGVNIGGYGGDVDKYPNYVNSLTISKINGRINTYTLNLTYQIRPLDDVNLFDKLLSRTSYTNELRITYGDSIYSTFREEKAIITDVTFTENVSNSSINYTITALSSSSSIMNSYFTFPSVRDKPSNMIRKLLYESGSLSKSLLEMFPAMASKTFVDSNNLIPNDDKEVTIGGYTNLDAISYLSTLVSCMIGISDNTPNYFLTFYDDVNGAYFKVNRVAGVSAVMMSSGLTDSLYSVTVGYPGPNFITRFELTNNIYWPLVYEYNDSIESYDYNIDNKGRINKIKTNSLYKDNKYYQESITNSNWWYNVTNYPISAKLTIKGLIKPILLTSYIDVETLFYGEEDLASGLYVVTAQEDSVSGNGYVTELTLLRISD